ncbi:hypothetical protein [Bacillus sp. AK128]
MERQLSIQRLIQLTQKKKPYCFGEFVPEIVIAIYLENGKPFTPFIHIGKECFSTKYLKPLHVDIETNCLFVRPVHEHHPSFKSRQCITLDLKQVCTIQFFEVNMNKEESYNELDELVTAHSDKATETTSAKRSKRTITFPHSPTITKNEDKNNAFKENEITDKKLNKPNTSKKGIDNTKVYSDEAKDDLIQNDSIIDQVIEAQSELEIEAELDTNMDTHILEATPSKQVQNKQMKKEPDMPLLDNKPRKKKKSKYNHWIVPVSSIIKIELDEENDRGEK